MPSIPRAPVHLVLVSLSLLWTMPSLGLLVSSLRPPEDVLTTGWWTVIRHPFDITQYSL